MAEIRIEEISHQHISDKLIDRLNTLLQQLTPRADARDGAYLREVVDQPDVYIYAAMLDDEIIGIVIGIVALTLLRKTMYIEEMVVDEEHRGKGAGKLLVEHALSKAQEMGVKEIDLTSNASRTSAIALYESFGFQKRDTNAFRLVLE